jgi:hypothetical protein
MVMFLKGLKPVCRAGWKTAAVLKGIRRRSRNLIRPAGASRLAIRSESNAAHGLVDEKKVYPAEKKR